MNQVEKLKHFVKKQTEYLYAYLLVNDDNEIRKYKPIFSLLDKYYKKLKRLNKNNYSYVMKSLQREYQKIGIKINFNLEFYLYENS